MVRELQKKFILIATAAVVALLLLALGTVNLVNYHRAKREVNVMLRVLEENDGTMPPNFQMKRREVRDNPQEISFRTRYFSVLLSGDGTVLEQDLDHVAAISEEEAETMAESMLSSGKSRGLYSTEEVDYAWCIMEKEDGGRRFIALDCTRIMTTTREFMLYSGILGLLCTLLYVIILTLMSRRAIQPIAKNMENQKRFITNAGHELKTPLAVISANAEVLEMMNGKSEWTDSIRNQVGHMTELVNRLIALSKLEEQEKTVLSAVDMTRIVAGCAESFLPVARQEGKVLQQEVAEKIAVMAEGHGARELVNILLDNAVKYCDAGGTITVVLERAEKEKKVRLRVQNSRASGSREECEKFFDRFYRGDESHSSTTPGFGIGLSMAEELAKSMKASISADWKYGEVIFTVLFLPAQKAKDAG